MSTTLLIGYSLLRDSLFSVIARLVEAYSPERIVVLVSERTDSPERVRKALTSFLEGVGAGDVKVEATPVRPYSPLNPKHSRPGTLQGFTQLRRELRSYTGQRRRIIVSPTPASRRLAAELSLAVGGIAASIGGDITLVHVDFCFGPWQGLYYPYIPRACNPIIVTPTTGAEEAPETIRRKLLPKMPLRNNCEIPGSRAALPPIRCRVAELAARINATSRGAAAFLDPGEGKPPSCGELVVEALASEQGRSERHLGRLRVGDTCDPYSWVEAVNAAEKLLEKIFDALAGVDTQEDSRQYGSWSSLRRGIIEFSGLEQLHANGEPLSEAISRAERVIIDTNLVYRGIHNIAYQTAHSGSKVVVPSCAVAEIHRRYAEDVKEHSHPARKLAVILAFNALEELGHANTPVVSSPPPPCDTAIPEMSTSYLLGSTLVTADRGAAIYWRKHPATQRLVDNILLATSSNIATRDPGAAMYAVLQLLVVLGTLEEILGKQCSKTREGKCVYVRFKTRLIHGNQEEVLHRLPSLPA